MKYNFDILHDRKNTSSIKWNRAQEQVKRDDVLALSVADMEFQSPPEITKAIIKRAASGIYGYSKVPGSYTQAYIEWVEKRYAWHVEKEMMTEVSGVVQAINVAVLAFTEPSDKILVQAPVYPPFFSSVKAKDRELVINNLVNESGYYKMDFNKLESQFKNNVKMMILCSPHNPVGRAWKKDELKQLTDLVVKYNVLLVSDEIHADIVYKPGKHICAASLNDEIMNNSITCISPTKTFNIPGVGISSAIIPNKTLMKKFVETQNKISLGIHDVFGPLAGETALREGSDWLNELLVYLGKNAAYMEDYIENNMKDVVFKKPEATYLGWLDFNNTKLPKDNLFETIAQRSGVVLNGGKGFGHGGEGFLRINFACPTSVLKTALERIKNCL